MPTPNAKNRPREAIIEERSKIKIEFHYPCSKVSNFYYFFQTKNLIHTKPSLKGALEFFYWGTIKFDLGLTSSNNTFNAISNCTQVSYFKTLSALIPQVNWA